VPVRSPQRRQTLLTCAVVSPRTFDQLLSTFEDHPVFAYRGTIPQLRVDYQLAIALYRFGHEGSGVSNEGIAQWAGVCSGTVTKVTNNPSRIVSSSIQMAIMASVHSGLRSQGTPGNLALPVRTGASCGVFDAFERRLVGMFDALGMLTWLVMLM
jgi:hypothetical protein